MITNSRWRGGGRGDDGGGGGDDGGGGSNDSGGGSNFRLGPMPIAPFVVISNQVPKLMFAKHA